MSIMGFLKKAKSVVNRKKGSFTVYVGLEKQPFMVKTEYANHPLFGMLLDESASEYGYQSNAAILLPCDVEFFCKVIAAMGRRDGDESSQAVGGFGKVATYFSPTRWRMNRREVDGSCSSTPYGLLSPLN